MSLFTNLFSKGKIGKMIVVGVTAGQDICSKGRYSLGNMGLEQMLRARHETPHPCNSGLTKLYSVPANNYTF